MVWYGMDPKLRRYEDSKNLEILARQAKKNEEEKIRESQIIRYDPINRQMDMLMDMLKKKEEGDNVEYEKIRKQAIFDKFGIDYRIVDEILNCKEYIRKVLYTYTIINNEDILYEDEEDEEENDNIISDGYDIYKKKEIKLKEEFEHIKENEEYVKQCRKYKIEYDNIKNKIEKYKNIFKIGHIGLLSFSSFIIVLIALTKSLWLFLLFLCILDSAFIIYFRKLKKEEKFKLSEYLNIKEKYDSKFEVFEMNKIDNIRNKYNNLLEEFNEFRKQHYNKEIEVALDLVGLEDENMLNEDLGQYYEYRKCLKTMYKDLLKVKIEAMKIPL